ncbi:MAG TPA: ABC transporter permease [Symbiobacteriaceae bacterium]|nr:ABC transporter permease [Symbiobacteriaceae bacterium]
MRNMWLVARREFVGRGKSSGYLITTVFIAIVLLGVTVLPTFMQRNEKTAPVHVLMLDNTGALAQPLEAALKAIAGQPGARELSLEVAQAGATEAVMLDRMKKEGKALLIVEGTYPAGLKARFLSTSPAALQNAGVVMGPLESIVRAARLQARGLDPAVSQEIMKPLAIETLQITEKGEGRTQNDFLGTMMTALGIVMVVYMVVMLNGQFVFQGVLEEKVSRVVEVMAASVGPGEMLAGKVLGLGALGLVQFVVIMASWVGGTLINRQISDAPVGSISVTGALVALVFLVLGYILAAALNAAAAATISRMEDQTAVAMPVQMIQVIPYMMLVAVMTDPNGQLATVLSMIPIFSQTVMVMRVLMGTVPLWQILTSIVLMAVTALVFVWGGGRIYRAALLSYGARPSMKQVLGYLRSN